MTKDKALKLALEALEGVLDDSPKVLDASIAGGLYEVVQCRDAITAIKEALAQLEQEPVAHRDGFWCADLTCKKCYSADFRFKHKTTPTQRTWVGLTDEQAHQALLDMAEHVVAFEGDGLTEQQLSAECIRFIIERVAAQRVSSSAPTTTHVGARDDV